MTDRRALVVGGTGIVGNNLARHLVEAGGWTVEGLARRPPPDGPPGVRPVAADLADADATRTALAGSRPTHVFYCTWTRRPTERENCEANGAMIRNLFDALTEAPIEHAALVTGTKHYLGPFESYGKTTPQTPFREDQPRLPSENFYYTQEDVLFDAAARGGFGWSVHRAHTIAGFALGNLMNIGGTLAAHAAICRETGRPFVFPGSPTQYRGVTDVTDARLLARHMTWAATTPAARNEAFNAVNGDVFRWERMWRVIAEDFGLEPAPYPDRPQPLEEAMADAGPVWERIVDKHGLQPNPLDRLASWWHTDADLGRDIECFNSMTKSRNLGFLDYQDSERSFLDLFERLRRERIIP